MSDYPDSDWPYTFYFNGEAMPKWTAQWHLCQLGHHLNDYEDVWDEYIGYKHIWHLQCRLDHVGVVESEDPEIFKICSQEVLLRMLTHRAEVIEKIKVNAGVTCSSEDVYESLINGLVQMLELTHRDHCAFWTSGYSEDQMRLKEFLANCQLPEDHPEREEPPHKSKRSSEMNLRAEFQLRDLRLLAQNGTLSKHFRRLINQLPG